MVREQQIHTALFAQTSDFPAVGHWKSQGLTSKLCSMMPVARHNNFKRLLEGFGFSYWEVQASSFHMSFLVLTRITGSRRSRG